MFKKAFKKLKILYKQRLNYKKSHKILKTLYKQRFNYGMIYYEKKNKNDDKRYFASKLSELGYIKYQDFFNPETGIFEGFNAEINKTGIEYFEKKYKSKISSLQTWMIVGLTIVNIALTALNIWLSFNKNINTIMH